MPERRYAFWAKDDLSEEDQRWYLIRLGQQALRWKRQLKQH